MSKIIRITPQRFKKQYRTVLFDSELSLKVHEEIVAGLHLAEGLDVSEEKLRQINEAEERKEALEYAYLFLSYRTRSSKEMTERLRRKGFSKEAITDVLGQLQKNKLVDDAEFARLLAESRLRHRMVGDIRIKQELQQKGIDSGMAERILEEIKAESPDTVPDEDERAYQVLVKRRRLIRNEDSRTVYRRLHDHLLRQGFAYDTVERALSRFKKERGMEEQAAREDDLT